MSPIHWRVLIIMLGCFATGMAVATRSISTTSAVIMALFTLIQYCFWRADMQEDHREPL